MEVFEKVRTEIRGQRLAAGKDTFQQRRRSAFLNAERLLVGRRNGARIKELPVRHYPRLSGKGGGSRLGKVAQAVADLFRTRLRWFRFQRYYGTDNR